MNCKLIEKSLILNIIKNLWIFYTKCLSLKKVKKHPSLVFLLAILITGILEYISGFMLLKIFNRTWWDYTGLFLNIDGFVCLRSVITFGIGALLLIYIFEPLIIKFWKKKPKLVRVIVISFLIIFIIDNILTFLFRY